MSDYEDNDNDVPSSDNQYTGGVDIEFDDTEAGGNISTNEAALLASLNFRYDESSDGSKTYNLGLNEVYGSLSSKYEDCNASSDQLFMIDGDSIILELLHDPHIQNGQLLHYIYAVENELNKLSQNDRQYNIIFFQCIGDTVYKSFYHKLIRYVVLLHLTHSHKFRHLVKTFDNWWDNDTDNNAIDPATTTQSTHIQSNQHQTFQQYINETVPSFVIVADGYIDMPIVRYPLVLANTLSDYTTLESDDESLLQYKSSAQSLIRSLTIYLLINRLPVVRLTELRVGVSGIVGFNINMLTLIRRMLETKAITTEYTTDLLVHDESEEPVECSDDENEPNAESVLSRVLQHCKNYDMRMIVSIYAISKLFDEQGTTSKTIELAKIYLLHTVLLQQLHISDRALYVDEQTIKQSAYKDLLPALLINITNVLPRFQWDRLHNTTIIDRPATYDNTLIDVFDIRLLHAVYNAITDNKQKITNLSLTDEAAKLLSDAWSTIIQLTEPDSNKSFLPLCNIDTLVADIKISENVESLADEMSKLSIIKSQQHKRLLAEQSVNRVELTPAPVVDAVVEEVPDSWDDVADDWESIADQPEPEPISDPVPVAAESTDSTTINNMDGYDPDEKVIVPDDSDATIKPIVNITTDLISELAGDVNNILQSNNLLIDEPYNITPNDFFDKNMSWKSNVQFDDGLVTVEPPLDKKAMRAVQRHIKYIEKLSAGLATGKVVFREVIISQQKSDNQQHNETSNNTGDQSVDNKKKLKSDNKASKGGAKAGKGAAMKEQILRDNAIKQLKKEQDEIAKKVRTADEHNKTLDGKIAELDNSLERINEPAVVPALLKLLEWCNSAWLQECKDHKLINRAMSAALRVHTLAHDIFRRFINHLEINDFNKIHKSLCSLGFNEHATIMYQQFITTQQSRLAESTASKSQLKSYKEPTYKSDEFNETSVNMSAQRFQLQYGGPYMLRNVDSAPDPRVSDFYPDKWQRDLLDVVDRRESALIIAPTSAGKTFISYYCMKQTLIENRSIERQKDRGIIIYVAPSKSLISQVQCDIYRRYGTVYGGYGDFPEHVLTSEVVIVIPDKFEQLLLSAQRQNWIQQIRYVIFDEVHSIGGEDGVIWERIIALNQAPFLALSATVGNPTHFETYLNKLHSHLNRPVHKIVHTARWSDLDIKYYVPPQPESIVTGNDMLKSIHTVPVQDSLLRVHPVAALSRTNELSETQHFPDELSFSPQDSLSLYDAMMQSNVPAQCKQSLDKLKPELYFQSLFMDKPSAIRYEHELKQLITEWLHLGVVDNINMIDRVQSIVQSLSVELNDAVNTMEQKLSIRNCYDSTFIHQHFFNLLLTLHQQQILPAVIFSFDRETMKSLAIGVTEQLERMEEYAKRNEVETADERAKAKEREKKIKAMRRVRDKVSGKKQEEEAQAGLVDDTVEEYEPDVDPRFSFLKEGEQMDSDELDFWLYRIRSRTGWNSKHPLIRALKRGIGIHHGGLNLSYRNAVETMFRGKYLKVVIAEKTLALGINMPAKSVVFCGDSQELTPLLYRQMSGRAGRRGYDNVGNIIFYSVPPRKSFTLMKSPLSTLQGKYPISDTLTLRMIQYYNGVSDQSFAIQSMNTLLRYPLFTHNNTSQHIHKQLQYHFRFTFQYLLKKQSIDIMGRSINFSTLLSFLRSQEPYNYAVVALFESEYIIKLCTIKNREGKLLKFKSEEATKKQVKDDTTLNWSRKAFRSSDKEKDSEDTGGVKKDDSDVARDSQRMDVARKLLSVLAHFFVRVPYPAHVTRDMLGLATQGQLILDPLSDEVNMIIDQHNQQTFNAYSNYLRVFARTQLEDNNTIDIDTANNKPIESLNQLPVSGLTVPINTQHTTPITNTPVSQYDLPDNTLLSQLQSNKIHTHARSPFVALSGHEDTFHSLRSFSSTVRNGIYISDDMIPAVQSHDIRGRTMKLNSYVVDYFKHQSFSTLLKENNLKSGYAWSLLKDWDSLLHNLSIAVTTIAGTQDNTAQAMEFLYNEYHKVFSSFISFET